ncbi:MAG: cytochrome c-type biogenesis protein [Pseudomonadota bacterium]
MIRLLPLLAALCLTLPVAHSQSIFTEYQFDNDEQQRDFKELTAQLRCLVCQNQNIADSNAPLAQDLRREIHEMLTAGDTKQDVVDFMVQRYGEFVLYKPIVSMKTLALWFGPALFFLGGLFIIWNLTRRSATVPATEPDRQSLAEARRLLEESDNHDR